jgi:hypothetical protein
MDGIELHAIVVKKPVKLERAIEVAHHITKSNKKMLIRETESSYRFRVKPKTKFAEFYSKPIDEKITLIFGRKPH